jgi:4-nitrophenyl phosphatase
VGQYENNDAAACGQEEAATPNRRLKPALLIDLDGTMYQGSRRISGADRLIRRLREEGIPFLFMTNNSSRTPEAVAEHLSAMGIEAVPEEVYTSSQAAAQYIVNLGAGKRVAMIGEEGLARALTDAGLEICDHSPDFVVQGIDRNFTYAKLKQAARLIMDGAVFISTNPDPQYPTEEGLIPGAGSISAALEAASQTKPVVVGKPSATIVTEAMRKLGVRPEQTFVVGDNLLTDIGAAKAAGIRSLLVLTGVTTRDNYARLLRQYGNQPDCMFDTLDDLAAYVSGLKQE